jgi:hypothetical protein
MRAWLRGGRTRREQALFYMASRGMTPPRRQAADAAGLRRRSVFAGPRREEAVRWRLEQALGALEGLA